MDDVEAVFGEVLGHGARIHRRELLSGGTSRATWDVTLGVGATPSRYVLQIERPSTLRDRDVARREGDLIRLAAEGGVPVPHVVAAGRSPSGAAYVLAQRIEGETIPRRLFRSPDHQKALAGFTSEVGCALARLHAIPVARVPWLPTDEDPVATWLGRMDALSWVSASFEAAVRWLGANRPDPRPLAIVHGDFRMGNLLFGRDGLAAVLDWELAHIGDPIEDLGWLCVRAWRYGQPAPVGGVGTRRALLDAYAAAGAPDVDPAELRWWEVFGTFRWGVICMQQVERHLSGNDRSVELAAIGRRVAETEYDVLRLLT